jgi:hypothetical protein
MPKKHLFLMAIVCLFVASMALQADNDRNALEPVQVEGIPQKLYPMGAAPSMIAEVACTVQMAADPYWAIGDWAVGDEIYKTYQDPTVDGINCEFPFEVDAIAMQLQFAAAGTVYVSVDVEEISAESLPACPQPGNIIDISDEWGFIIPGAGMYLIIVPFNSPVTVNEAYFCGFYMASNVYDLGCEIITDNDPYLCVNWNDWGEGYVDLVQNSYYNFPGNLILYSIGRSGGSSGLLPLTDFTWPPDSSTVYGNVYLRAGELVDTVTFDYCRFEYYNPGTGWTTIYDDPLPYVSLRNSVFPADYQEGYSAQWDATGLGEGWYQLVSSIYDTRGYSTSDTIQVYLDNTPLRPEFTNPDWCGTICDSVTLVVDIPDEDITFAQFETRPALDTLRIFPPQLLQSRYGDTDNDTLDGNQYIQGEYGDFYNAPTVLTSIIRFFANQGYTDVVMAGSSYQTDREIVEGLAMNIKVRQNLGSEDDNFIWATRKYFKDRGDQFAVKLITTLTAKMLDYIMGFRLGAALIAIGEPYGIWLSINEFDLPQNQDGSFTVKIYDTKTGQSQSTPLKFDPYPQVFYDGQYRPIDLCLGIYPEADTVSRTVIGLDFNPSDGYSFYWNTSAIEDGTYYVTVTGVDQGGHMGDAIVRASISCQAYVSSDVNGDNSVNVSDAVYLINYVFTGGPEPLPVLMNGDANCDDRVNVSDAVYLINYVFTGGPPPCN